VAVAFFLFGPSVIAASKRQAKEAASDRVWITRPDGSLQCDPKEEGTAADPVKKAQSQLEKSGVRVLQAQKRNDGAMRAAACGISTGNETSFLIEARDFAQAKALGFEKISDPVTSHE
jgi:hypothetical protein